MVYPYTWTKEHGVKPSEDDQEDSQIETEIGQSWRFGVNNYNGVERVKFQPPESKSDRARYKSSRQEQNEDEERWTG